MCVMPDGRLANPDCSLGTDPRSDPRMVKAFAAVGMDALVPALTITPDSPLEDRLAFAAKTEEMSGSLFGAFAQATPVAKGVTTTTVTIPGGDGQDLTLYVSRPEAPNIGVALPCVVHLHGGGMAFLSAADASVLRGRENLSGTGLIVVGVEFRNSAGKLGPHPHPAGLNDCAAAVRWVFANRELLGVTHLIVSGESGGGNLTLAVTHKAKREGWLHEIAGAVFGSLYDPEYAHSDDPTCWPSAATEADLSGMPAHVISVNELDPLRDEGLDYYRRLVRAGVAAIGRMVAGTCHGGDMLLPGEMPEVYMASIRDVSGFAKSLA